MPILFVKKGKYQYKQRRFIHFVAKRKYLSPLIQSISAYQQFRRNNARLNKVFQQSQERVLPLDTKYLAYLQIRRSYALYSKCFSRVEKDLCPLLQSNSADTRKSYAPCYIRVVSLCVPSDFRKHCSRAANYDNGLYQHFRFLPAHNIDTIFNLMHKSVLKCMHSCPISIM